MITEYVNDLARQKGMRLSGITIVKKPPAGCHDAYLLEISSNNKIVSERIHQSELDNLQKGFCSDLLDLKVRAALARLKIILED